MVKKVTMWVADNGSLHDTEHAAIRENWVNHVLLGLTCPKPRDTEWEASWWDGAVAAAKQICDLQNGCETRSIQLELE